MTAWWGETRLEVDEVRKWRVGPLRLHAWRRAREWWTHTRVDGDWREQALDIAAPAEWAEVDDDNITRFAADGANLELKPALPDRAVVVRPEREFVVPARGRAEIFVSVPLWVQLRLPPHDEPVLDHEIFANKLTWLGADPTAGELCYASRTFARASLDDIEPRPHRAVVRVVLRNKGPRFVLERLLLPARHLALYEKDGGVWTDDLFYERGDDDDDDLQLHENDWRRPPEGATKLAAARESSSKSVFERVFSPLFARERTFS